MPLRDQTSKLEALAERAAYTIGLIITTAAIAIAGQGPPDAGGWAWIDSNEPGIDTSVEVATLAPVVSPFADDEVVSFTMANPFTLYTTTSNTVYISSNGWLSLGPAPADSEPGNIGMPDPVLSDAKIAYLWDDHINGGASFAFEGPTANGHQLLVRHIEPGGGFVQITIQFYDNGSVKIVYQTNPSIGSATIGIENGIGSIGTELARDGVLAPTFAPGANYAVLFYPARTVDCSAATPVGCPSSFGGTTIGGATSADSYGCAAGTYTGSETVYEVTLTGAGSLDVTLGGLGLRDLDVFLMRQGCDATFGCVGGGADVLSFPLLGAGTYLLVVDGVTAADDGAFTLDVSCGPVVSSPISCGASANGLAGTVSNVAGYTCLPGDFSGPEEIFSFTIPGTRSVVATLNPPAPFDLILTNDLQPGVSPCLLGDNNRVSVFDLPAGSYSLVVDGPATAAGSYTVDLECTERVFNASCGTPVSGVTVGTSFTDTYFCSGELMTGPETYYQVTVAPGTPKLEARLTAAPPDARIIIAAAGFDPETNPTCVNVGNSVVTVYDPPPGVYNIIVDSLASAGAHDVDLDCSLRLGCSTTPLTCGVTLSDTTVGAPGDANQYPCWPGEYTGPERVYVFDNPFPQRVSLNFVPAVPGLEALFFDNCEERDCSLGSGTGGACLEQPAGRMYVVVDGLDGAAGDFDLTVECAALASGLDVVPGSVDVTAMITDPLSLDVSGTVSFPVFNRGALDVVTPTGVVVFEDLDGSGDWSGPGLDNQLGLGSVGPLASGASLPANVVVTGRVQFLDNWVWAAVDEADVVSESNEANNSGESGAACVNPPVIGSFNVTMEWEWTDREVSTAPIVVNLTDDNIDGLINELDIPDVVFSAWNNVTVALSGDTGAELWTNAVNFVSPTNNASAADIDGDGIAEIVMMGASGNLIALEHDGSHKWTSTAAAFGSWAAPHFADLDNDGLTEIMVGSSIFDNTGTFICSGVGGRGGNNSFSTAADLDLDGVLELVAGNTAYRNDCSVYWQQSAIPDGSTAIANFDSDPNPEVVIVANGQISLLEHDGTVVWTFNPGSTAGGPPTISDVDDDCFPEIGVAFNREYILVDAFGVERWRSPTVETSSGVTGSSVFDFDGDGLEEIVYADEQDLRIFNGLSGALLWSTPNTSWTWAELPAIADIDRDQSAEIVVGSNMQPTGTGMQGMRAYGEPTWVNTRSTWNQHTYHITNIEDGAQVPAGEARNWDVYNNFRTQVGEQILDAHDATASRLQLDCTSPDTVTATVRLGSGGHIEIPGDVDVSFYDGDPGAGGTLITRITVTGPLTPESWVDVVALIGPPLPASGSVWVMVDDLTVYDECNEINNLVSAPLPESPIADAGIDIETCAGGDVTVIGGGTTPLGCVDLEYRWLESGLPVTIWNTDPSYTYPPTVSTVLTLEVRCSNSPSCYTMDDVVVTVNPGAASDPGADQTICLGEGATLTGNGIPGGGCLSVLYRWLDGTTELCGGWGPTPTCGVTPTTTTTYTLEVRCASSPPECLSSANTTVTVVPPPTAAAGIDELVCVDAPLTLDATGSTDPGCPGGLTYTWYNGAVVVGTGPTFDPPTTTVGITTYDVVVSCTGLAGCDTSDPVEVEVEICISLAVIFDHFTAEWIEHEGGPAMLLSWATLMEQGTRTFEIERSLTRDGVFSSIGDLVRAMGPGHPYNFIDPDAEPGTQPYYRIVERTMDGRGDETPPFTVVESTDRRSRTRSGRSRLPSTRGNRKPR